MAGYCEFSKSNNALDAEAGGRFPASLLARRLGVKTGAIQAILEPCEWHHTSKHYNRTRYYDGAALLALAQGETPDDLDAEEIAAAQSTLDALRAWRPAAAEPITLSGCTVSWLEWSGSARRPRAEERRASDCTVIWAGGAFVTITCPDGTEMKKKLGARGLFIVRAGFLPDGRGLPTISVRDTATHIGIAAFKAD
ncbi:MAG: hypothetical protein HQL38_10815 [Alphaproteobacteria bacterium]|nr:hypothetical protein [Alphaproteobacteria bacterium]